MAKIKNTDLNIHGVFISIGFCIIVITLAHYYSKRLSNVYYHKAMTVYEADKSKK